MSKHENLERAATKLLKNHSMFQQLKELGDRKNYPSKLKKLEEKLLSEVDLWQRKGQSARLEDLKKDLTFVQKQQQEPFFDKERIDILTNKYSIGYDKNGYTE